MAARALEKISAQLLAGLQLPGKKEIAWEK